METTKNEWSTPYFEINFENPDIKMVVIDTRDFECAVRDAIPPKKAKEPYDKKGSFHEIDLDKIAKYGDRFFHTPETVKAILDHLYNGSNGPGKWRHLMLELHKERTGWDLKYLRLFHTDKGWLICSDHCYALSNEILTSPIQQLHLNHH